MYAIIRTGGKQQKVHEGDVLDVERIKNTDQTTFTPLLLVSDDGTVVSDKDALAKASVTVEIVGEHRGPKIDVFTYKNKSGNRRRSGHRQTYTTVKVTKIDSGVAKAAKKPAKKGGAKADTKAEAPAEASETPAADESAAEEA
jgi:large subunit ribosomal protein L21